MVQLQNNNLRTIPYELVDVVTLEEIDFSGNDSLTMVPKLWQGDTNSVLFVCKVHRDYNFQMSEISSANSDLVKHCQFLEQEQLLMKVSGFPSPLQYPCSRDLSVLFDFPIGTNCEIQK